MLRDRAEQAWNQGYDAGCRLLPSDSNPYKVNSRLHEAWEDGWQQGSDPNLEEMERRTYTLPTKPPGRVIRAHRGT